MEVDQHDVLLIKNMDAKADQKPARFLVRGFRVISMGNGNLVTQKNAWTYGAAE